MNTGDVGKEVIGFLHRHIQDIIDILPLVANLQGFPVVAFSITNLAWHIDIRQEMHLDLYNTVSGAGLTTSTLHIEGETPLGIASLLGILGTGKEVTNQVKDTGIGCGVGTGGSSNRALVNVNDLIQGFQALHLSEFSGNHFGLVQDLGTMLMDDFIDERGLSGTGNAGNTGEYG